MQLPDFTLRLKPVLEHLPHVLTKIVHGYTGNELVPRITVAWRPHVLGVVEKHGSILVYWMRGRDIMCNNEPLCINSILIPVSMQYIDGNSYVFNEWLYTKDTGEWRQFDASVSYFRGHLFLAYDTHIERRNIRGEEPVVLWQGPTTEINIIGDCLMLCDHYDEIYLPKWNQRFEECSHVYEWNSEFIRFRSHYLIAKKKYLFHSYIENIFAWGNIIFIQCFDQSSFLFDMNTNVLIPLAEPREYNLTQTTLWSISKDNIFVY